MARGTLPPEITESGMMTDPDTAIAMLWGLRRVGSGCRVDDFGTGYSSLACLERLPLVGGAGTLAHGQWSLAPAGMGYLTRVG